MTTYRERHLAGVHDAKKQAAKAARENEKLAKDAEAKRAERSTTRPDALTT